VDGAQRAGVRRWLSAARHPARRDGVIAAALLVLPWVLVWALAPHHHLGAPAVTVLVSVTIPLAGLWLTWAAFRNASKPGQSDRDEQSGQFDAELGNVSGRWPGGPPRVFLDPHPPDITAGKPADRS
jgi:hypothetical protein